MKVDIFSRTINKDLAPQKLRVQRSKVPYGMYVYVCIDGSRAVVVWVLAKGTLSIYIYFEIGDRKISLPQS